MVHALELSYGLLKPDGLLVDVHNLPVPAVIEVCTDAQVIKAGWLLDNTDFESERLAFGALIGETASGIFALEDVRDFAFEIYADDIDEFRSWLSEWWESAFLPESTI